MTSAGRMIAINGLDWTESFFLKRVGEITERMIMSSFARYPKTADVLKAHARIAKELLLTDVDSWRVSE